MQKERKKREIRQLLLPVKLIVFTPQNPVMCSGVDKGDG